MYERRDDRIDVDNMGIDTERFVSSVPLDAHCIICSKVLEDPVEVVDCGHLICSKCWENVISKDKDTKKSACPFCGTVVSIYGVRKSNLTWNLIQNMDVFCSNKDAGCECIYKYNYDNLHRPKCPYEKTERLHVVAKDLTKCSTCGVTSEGKHDCITELLRTLKRQTIQISNLELEKKKFAFQLATREKGQPETERNFLMETLKYNKEIRDLRTRLAVMQGEMGRRKGDCNFEKINISLERIDGSLGFNIIGGTSSKDVNSSSGIYVSRIVEGGAADQPGKLELHDQIIEVDGLDLRCATHAVAVQTFRNAGDPVKMTIQRQIKRNITCDVSTQTFGVMFAVTGEEKCCRETEIQKNIRNKSNWLTLHDFNKKEAIDVSDFVEPVKEICDESKDENKSELYDSAYDTLLTQRSSRSLRPSTDDQSDLESGVCLQKNTKLDDVVNPRSSDAKDKRHSTFYVIPGDVTPSSERREKHDTWEDGASVEQEIEYEYEYQEVILRKEESGKYGLLLCYGGDATDVAVYVGDMEENSVADASGKIMVGDQIVQINGCHVSDVDQAYQMLQENDEIALIVARAVYEVQSEYFDDPEETDLDILDSIIEESEPSYDIQASTSKFASSVSISTSVSSNSAASSRDAVYSNSCSQVPITSKRCDASTATIAHNFPIVTEDVFSDSQEEQSINIEVHKNEKDSMKNSLKNFVKNALGHSEKKDKQNSSISKDLCDVSKFQRSDSNSSSSSTRKHSNSSGKSHDSLELLKSRLKEQKHLSKMKAYVDSPSLNRHRPKTSSISSQFNSYSYPNQNVECIPAQPTHNVNNVTPSIRSTNSDVDKTCKTYRSAASLKSAMKNNVSESSKTVKHVQIDPHPDWNETERRVWEEFKIIQSMEAKESKGQSDDLKIEAEWRVRRSKDGKHIYIKKTNTARSRILKEREKQIDLERCGITTDDDAFTVYQGQYWNKDQRRRQLNRHNDRRKRIVQKAAQKALYENKTEKVMAEIVQRKMTLPGKVFDNFVTVEEILSQRNRSGIFEGPVHVTTI